MVRKHCTQNLSLSCQFIYSVYRLCGKEALYTESVSELSVYLFCL